MILFSNLNGFIGAFPQKPFWAMKLWLVNLPPLTNPPRNKALLRLYEGKPMVNKPLIRPYFWGRGYVRGGRLTGHDEEHLLSYPIMMVGFKQSEFEGMIESHPNSPKQKGRSGILNFFQCLWVLCSKKGCQVGPDFRILIKSDLGKKMEQSLRFLVKHHVNYCHFENPQIASISRYG